MKTPATCSPFFLVGDDEDARDVLAISYINEEYLSQLQQHIFRSFSSK